MNYCKRCLYPDTKPDLIFNNEGVCSACTAFEQRKNIDWSKRLNKFELFVKELKTRNQEYDCIIPVSGGKDSHYQVIKALEYGLKPLAVTAQTDDLSELGLRNLNNIVNLGVDHVIVSVDVQLRKRINNYTLETIGDISWAEHVTIFTIPVREALIRKIPYILWGENPQNEYGGPDQERATMKLGWLQEYGGLNGLRVSDIKNHLNLPYNYTQYEMPYDADWVESHYLGYYFPWDGMINAEIAAQHGFKWSDTIVEGTGVRYENLDNYQTGIHDYFKWLKFGFGRATDIACNHIRRGIISRNEAKEFIWLYDGQFPSTYLGRPLEKILQRIDMTVGQFMFICDQFTNKAIFHPREHDRPKPRLKHHVMEI